MGQTTKGIVYPSDYSEVADVPADMQTMAESIDELLQDIDEQCEDYALITETGNKIELVLNTTTFKISAVLKDKNNNTINTSNEIDLPIEGMITNISYNNKNLIITYQSGQTSTVSIADLISGLVSSNDIVDNLTTNDSTKVLSAKQGKVLYDMIGDVESLLEVI